MKVKLIESNNTKDFEKQINEFEQQPNINVRATQTHVTNVPDGGVNVLIYTGILYYLEIGGN